jgi:tetratricopeptide (TPR) repeat protein
MRAGRGLRQAALLVVLSGHAGPAGAVAGFDAEPAPAPSNDAYAAGVAAFEQEDWQGVLDHMSQALEARPWQDNAHNLMGFAYRKLGDYPAALDAYGRALTLNPYNRGALEYLGEAYLELDRPADARATLDRLAEACRRIAHGAIDPLAACAEWQELSDAYEAYLANVPSAETE